MTTQEATRYSPSEKPQPDVSSGHPVLFQDVASDPNTTGQCRSCYPPCCFILIFPWKSSFDRMCMITVGQNKDLCYSRVCLLYPHQDQPEKSALLQAEFLFLALGSLLQVAFPNFLPSSSSRHSTEQDGLPDPSEIRNGVSLERSELFVLFPLQTTAGTGC